MSKQYLTAHTIDDAHPTDIFALAPTTDFLLSASGGSAINVYDINSPDYPLVQVLEHAHPLGCHHLVASSDNSKAASAGFDGSVKLWSFSKVDGASSWKGLQSIKGPHEIWALALSPDGRFLAATSYDGKITVWDTKEDIQISKQMETKGSFGMCIEYNSDGRLIATGHENGSVYLFSHETGRLSHSLPSLINPVRAVAFSPGNKLLAAAGDARTIALYDVTSGEQVAMLSGHSAWIMSLAWSHTGEFLLSGAFDGKIKVWSIETRSCVATHGETDATLWSVKWLPKTNQRMAQAERFVVGGAHRSISVYREASGG